MVAKPGPDPLVLPGTVGLEDPLSPVGSAGVRITSVGEVALAGVVVSWAASAGSAGRPAGLCRCWSSFESDTRIPLTSAELVIQTVSLLSIPGGGAE
ncbi:hypothetical protein [Nocardia sp. NPDC020380]|uniref:hypothetical protein n=1 Tax=Nocardia sp. NPDC020380 TaxID=3364309 RepID=UPI0037AA2207